MSLGNATEMFSAALDWTTSAGPWSSPAKEVGHGTSPAEAGPLHAIAWDGMRRGANTATGDRRHSALVCVCNHHLPHTQMRLVLCVVSRLPVA